MEPRRRRRSRSIETRRAGGAVVWPHPIRPPAPKPRHLKQGPQQTYATAAGRPPCPPQQPPQSRAPRRLRCQQRPHGCPPARPCRSVEWSRWPLAQTMRALTIWRRRAPASCNQQGPPSLCHSLPFGSDCWNPDRQPLARGWCRRPAAAAGRQAAAAGVWAATSGRHSPHARSPSPEEINKKGPPWPTTSKRYSGGEASQPAPAQPAGAAPQSTRSRAHPKRCSHPPGLLQSQHGRAMANHSIAGGDAGEAARLLAGRQAPKGQLARATTTSESKRERLSGGVLSRQASTLTTGLQRLSFITPCSRGASC